MKKKLNAIKYLGLALLLVIMSCEDLSEINENPDAINDEEVNVSYVLTSMLVESAKTYTNEIVYWSNYGISQAVQYLQKDYIDYDVNNFLWSPVSFAYKPIKESAYIYERAGKMEEEQRKNYYQGVSLIMKSFWFGFYTSVWGDIPYSEAMQAEIGLYKPRYDRQQDIYTNVLDDLEKANDLLKDVGILPEARQADIIYQGDALRWRKLANSLRLRYYMRLSEKAPEMLELGIDIKGDFNEIVTNPGDFPIIENNSDNAAMNYVGTTEENSWPGGPLTSSNRSQFYRRKPASTIINSLKELQDPRLTVWFRPVDVQIKVDPDQAEPNRYVIENGKIVRYISGFSANVDTSLYVGLLPAMREPDDYNLNNSANYTTIKALSGEIYLEPAANPHVSYLSDAYSANYDPIVKSVWMSAAEVDLILAEARLKEWISTGTVEDYFERGIRHGIEQYDIHDGDQKVYNPDTHQLVSFDLSAYLAERKNELSSATSGEELLEVVLTEKWVALWMTPEYWFDWRRSGLPDFSKNLVAASNGDKIPVRFQYGETEHTLNRENVQSGISNLSPAEDNIWSKMWLLQNTDQPW